MTSQPTHATPTSRIAARRDYNGPDFLSQGFRPFFLGAGLWAVIAMTWWQLSLFRFFENGVLSTELDTTWLYLHIHEMLFGFASAAIAGFLLTAIPNWTGRLPVRGWPLATLFALWILGRISLLGGIILGNRAVSALDGIFLIVLSFVVFREIIAGRNWRNLILACVLLAFSVANVLHIYLIYFYFPHSSTDPGFFLAANSDLLINLGYKSQVLAPYILALLVILMGGRVIPSFSRNWLARQNAPWTPRHNPMASRMAFWSLFAAMFLGSFSPFPYVGTLFLVITTAANFWLLFQWRGWLVRREPMLLIMHTAYAWLVFGLGALALADLFPLSTFFTALPDAGRHALTAGAFGTMILSIMTRASRGHSGLPLKADKATTLIYVLITCATLTRVGGAFIPAEALTQKAIMLLASSNLWILAFLTFVIAYWKILTTDMRSKRSQ